MAGTGRTKAVTVDTIDDSYYKEYAERQLDIAKTLSSIKINHLDEISLAHYHALAGSVEACVSMTDALMGMADPSQKTLAFFKSCEVPRELRGIMSLGPEDPDKQAFIADKILGVPVDGRIDSARKSAIGRMFESLGMLNRWLIEVRLFQTQYQKG